MNVTAVCERSGNWWAVTIPEIEGGYTQAKRLDQVPAMVADLVNLANGTARDQVRVTLHVRDENADIAIRWWNEARRLEAESRRLQHEAADRSRFAIDALRQGGLSVRDAATLLEVSPQRVSQLATDKGRAKIS